MVVYDGPAWTGVVVLGDWSRDGFSPPVMTKSFRGKTGKCHAIS